MSHSRRKMLQETTVSAKHFKMYKAGKQWMIAGLTIAAFGVGSQMGMAKQASAETVPTTENTTAANTTTAKATTQAPAPTVNTQSAQPTESTPTATAVATVDQKTPATQRDQSATSATNSQVKSAAQPVSQTAPSESSAKPNDAQPATSTQQPQQIKDEKTTDNSAQQASNDQTTNKQSTPQANQTNDDATTTKQTTQPVSTNQAAKDQKAADQKTAATTEDTQKATADQPVNADDLSYDQAVNVYNSSKQLYGIITNQLSQAKSDYDQQLAVCKDKLAAYNKASEAYQNNQNQYGKDKAGYDQAKAEYEAAKTAYETKKTEYDRLKALNEKTAADYTAAKNKAEEAVASQTAQKGIYDAALAKYETARQAYEQARTEYEKGQGSQTDAQFNTIAERYNSTKADYDKTNTEFQEIKATYEATPKQVADLQQPFKNADATQKQINEQFAAINSEYTTLQDQYQKAHSTFATLEDQFTKAGVDFINQTAEFDKLKADYETVKAAHDALAERYSVAQGAYDTLADRLTALNERYEIELKNYQAEKKIWDEAYAKAMKFEQSVAESLPEKTANPVLPGLQLSTTDQMVNIGDNGVFNLHFDANGIRTIYTNADLVVSFPKDAGILVDTSDLSRYQIGGTTPTYDAATKTLTYHWDSLDSGLSQDLHYSYLTDKASLANNQIIQMGVSFKADELPNPVQVTASQQLAISNTAMITNQPSNTYTDEFGKEYKNPAPGDTAIWNVIVSIPTSQPKVGLLEPDTPIDIYYYVAGSQSYVGLTKATPENGLVDTPPEISKGELPDGTPATILKWTFKAADIAGQLANDQTMKFQVIAKVDKTAENFQWVKTDVGIGLTFLGGQPVTQQNTNKIAATMVLPHDPATWNIPYGSWVPMAHYGSADGVGNLAGIKLLNPDPQVYSDSNALLKFYDTLVPIFMSSDVDGELPESERLRDFNYYALHQTIDPREDLNQIIIHNFVYQPTGNVKSSKAPTGARNQWTYLQENPYLTMAVKYQGDAENQYHVLFENLPTVTQDVEKDQNGAPIYAVSGEGSSSFIYVNRQQLLAAGLDPTKNVVEVYMYMHKKGMGDIPSNPDTISRESIYKYPDLPYKFNQNEKETIIDKNGKQRTIFKRDVLKSPEEGGLPAGSWAPYGINGGIYFGTVLKLNAEPGTITHQMTPKVSWSNARTYVSLENWMSDADVVAGMDRWLAKDDQEKQAAIDGSLGWPGVVWQFLKPSTVEVAKRDISADRYITSAIHLDSLAGGSVISPGAHQLTLGFILDKTSVGNIAANDGPFVTYTVMPKGVSFDYDASMTNGVIPFGNQYSVIDNFNGTGQQVLKIVWPDKSIMVPGESSGTRVIVNIDDRAPKDLVFHNFVNLGTEKENYTMSAPNVLQPTILNTQKIADGSTTGLIDTKTPLFTSGTVYILDKDATLQTSQLVSAAGKDDYHHNVAIEAGKQATVKIQFNENTDNELTQLDLLDFLPQAGKVEGMTTTDVRESTFSAGLAGPITLPSDWNGKVNVYYTTDSQQTVAGNLNQVGWQSQDTITDWSKVTAFRVILDETSGQTISGHPAEGITFNVTVPTASTFISKYAEPGKQVGVSDLADKLTGEIAYNSYVMAANHLNYTEPLQVGIKVWAVNDPAKEPAKPTLEIDRPVDDSKAPEVPVTPIQTGNHAVDVNEPTAPEPNKGVVAEYTPNLDEPSAPIAPIAPKKVDKPVVPGGGNTPDPNKPDVPTVPSIPSTPNVPNTPNTPTPSTPQTPSNDPQQIVNEVKEKTPKTNGTQPGETQAAKQQVDDQLTVKSPSQVVHDDSQAATAATQTPATQTASQEKLPQTGENQTDHQLSVIGMILMAMFAWIGFGRKKRKEDD